MDRPEFDDMKSFAEFNKYYWYREELIKICKNHGLKAPSGKIELYKVIEAYFSGEKILPEKKTVTELTRETGLIECGFTFGPRFREFFVNQTREPNFKFNVDMVATAKKVKETGDESFTLGDLLDVYYGKKTYATYDKSALQWNKFVHDFCADDATKGFEDRLKAAAALWKIVRDSDREKKYSRELLEEFEDYVKAHQTKDLSDVIIYCMSEKYQAEFEQILQEYLPGSELETVRGKAENYPETCLVALQDEKVIGIAFGWPREAALPQKEYCLDGIAVRYDHWRKGIGSMLLAAFEEGMQKYGYRKLSVGSAEGFAEKFYLKNGFVPKCFKTYADEQIVVRKDFLSLEEYENYQRMEEGFVVFEKET